MRLRRAFGIVAKAVVTDPHLTPTEKCVYALLCCYADDDGVCYPSNETLAADLNVSKDTVKRAIGRLQAAEILTRVERYVDGRQTSSLTRLIDAAVHHRGDPDAPPQGGVHAPQNKTTTNRTKEQTTSSSLVSSTKQRDKGRVVRRSAR